MTSWASRLQLVYLFSYYILNPQLILKKLSNVENPLNMPVGTWTIITTWVKNFSIAYNYLMKKSAAFISTT